MSDNESNDDNAQDQSLEQQRALRNARRNDKVQAFIRKLTALRGVITRHSTQFDTRNLAGGQTLTHEWLSETLISMDKTKEKFESNFDGLIEISDDDHTETYSSFLDHLHFIRLKFRQKLKEIDDAELEVAAAVAQVFNPSPHRKAIQLAELNLQTLSTSIESAEVLPERISLQLSCDLSSTMTSYVNAFNTLSMNLVSQDELAALQTEHRAFVQRVTTLQVRLSKIAPQQSTITSNHQPRMKLAVTPVPTFDGSEEKWILFRDTFERLVHNNASLSDIEKFSHLINAYKPTSHDVLKGIQVTEQCYTEAWSRMRARYDDKEKVRNHYFHTLLNLQKIQASSCDELLRFCDDFSAILINLITMESSLDNFISYLVMTKLDERTLLAYKRDIGVAQPSTVSLKNFLNAYAKSISPVTPQHKSTTSRSPSSTAKTPGKSLAVTNASPHQSTNSSCLKCKESHKLYQCDAFKTLNRSAKYDFLKKYRLCFNCLGSGHALKDCPSKSRCRQCERQNVTSMHHTLLHDDSSNSRSSSEVNRNTSQSSTSSPNQPRSSNAQAAGSSNSQPVNSQSSFQRYPASPSRSQPSSESSTQCASCTSSQPLNFRSSDGRIEPTFQYCHSAVVNQISNALPATTYSCNSVINKPVLTTAMVEVANANGQRLNVRALLDTGSDTNFITMELAKALGLPMEDIFIPVQGIGGKTANIDRAVTLKIHSKYGTFSPTLKFLVIPHIIERVPTQLINTTSLNIPKDKFLADPKWNVPSQNDLLIASDVVMYAWLGNVLRLNSGVTLVENMFGWVVGGVAPQLQKAHALVSASPVQHVKESKDLQIILEKFIDCENIGIGENASTLSRDEQYCEDLYASTTTRNDNGTYIVKLPVKPSISELESNYSKAVARLKQLDYQRNNNPKFAQLYEAYVNEMIKSGVISEIDSSLKNEGYFLAHHAVYKDSTTTKLRPVCDGSSKSQSGLSLNDCLYIGPMVQPESYDILMRFRQGPFALKCDLEKMFLRILVDEFQRKYQKFLWTETPGGHIKHYQFNTVIFGLGSSPYLATKTVNQIAMDNRSSFPQTSELIRTSFYVDDGLFSFNSFDDALNARHELQYLFNLAGMNARKFASNVSQLLDGLSEDDIEKPNEENVIKVLGHLWNVNTDTLSISFKIPDNKIINKKTVLSTIASFYDVFGIFGPVILTAKLFMKSLTEQKLALDEAPNQKFQDDWIIFCNELKCVNSLFVPRHFLTLSPERVDIHAFADASEKAFGCCIYIRSTNSSGEVKIELICSKSRVAPSKAQTLARLELCAATLLARLTHRVVNSILSVKIDSVNAWSDSMITLHWIKNLPSRYNTYVANRISAIQQHSENFIWRHIPGADNPADLISRGLMPSEIESCTKWWKGPSFLSSPVDTWPHSEFTFNAEVDEVEHAKEIRKCLAVKQTNELVTYIETRFSRCRYLLNLFILITRWKKVTRARRIWTELQIEKERTLALQPSHRMQLRSASRNTSSLAPSPPEEFHRPTITADDEEVAILAIIKILQKHYYPSEYSSLSTQDALPVSKTSDLCRLSPFYDSRTEVLRVGGRIEHCDFISFSHKHPVLLPNSHFSRIFITYKHKEHNHPPKAALLAYIRQKYWPIKGKVQVSSVTRHCLICFRLSIRKSTQFMADLPSARMNFYRPFKQTAVDFAGYFKIKASLTCNSAIVKVHVAMFKCMNTGAIHLELVTSLETESFLLAFDRFAARRGLCSELFSDNGTNFHGADSHFAEAFRTHSKDMGDHLRDKGIHWIFTTPKAPHAGGYYEAGIKTFKHYLYRSLETHTAYDYELFSTLLCKIEGDINSRPLIPLSDDPNDFQALTPAHFLIFEPLNARPERNFLPVKDHLLTTFDKINKARQHFSREYYLHYLNTLQERPKNALKPIEYKVGQLVIMHKKNFSPRHWPMARIVKLYPGKDEIVRNVRVKTETSEYDRHVNYLATLPIAEDTTPAGVGSVLQKATLINAFANIKI